MPPYSTTPLPPLDSCFPTDFDIVLMSNNPLSLFYQKDLKRTAAHISEHMPGTPTHAFH